MTDTLAIDVSPKIVDTPIFGDLDASTKSPTAEESQWRVITGVLTYKGRIYIPTDDSLCGKVTIFHDNPESGHFGAMELMSRDIY